MGSTSWVRWAPTARWLRTRPWQVWAAAGAVFLLFAVLGAVTRTPAMTAVAGGPGLADGLERGGGARPVAPVVATPTAAVDGYPEVSYPRRTPGAAGMPTPSTTAAYFPDCAAAEAAGMVPIRRGSPGYRAALDRDGDGIACDTTVPAPTTGPAAPSTPAPTVSPSPTPTPTTEPTPTETPSPTAEPTTAPPIVDPPTG